MAEWLVLQLPRGSQERVSWMPADVRGQPIGVPQLGTLEEAAAAAAGRRLAVLLPAGDVLQTTVELPVKSGVRLQQVVPYALEEQLAADIETLHFAAGARNDADGRTPVAVITRELLDQCLATLRAVHLAPEVVCSEAALLPENPGHVVVLLQADSLCIGRAGQLPASLPAAQLAEALAAAVGESLREEHLIVYVSPEDWQRRGGEFEALRTQAASLKVQLLNFGPLPLLTPQLASGRYLNLLSGEYAPKSTFTDTWRRWRVAAVLAAALLVLHLGGLLLQQQQQRHTERSLDAAITRLARPALPRGAAVDPDSARQQVQRRLLAAAGDADSSGLMPALGALARALNGAGGTSIESLHYHDGTLELKLQAPDAEKLARVGDSLRSNGWQAQLTAGAHSGSSYEGRIQARPPGPAGNRR